METRFYMMRDILTKLEEQGYKISRPTFEEYEKHGVINRPERYAIAQNGRKVRFYTEAEVSANTDRIILYIQQKRSKTLL